MFGVSGSIRSIFPYSVQIRENTDQKNSEHEDILRDDLTCFLHERNKLDVSVSVFLLLKCVTLFMYQRVRLIEKNVQFYGSFVRLLNKRGFRNSHCTKMKLSIKYFFTFTEEILNRKVHVLHSVNNGSIKETKILYYDRNTEAYLEYDLNSTNQLVQKINPWTFFRTSFIKFMFFHSCFVKWLHKRDVKVFLDTISLHAMPCGRVSSRKVADLGLEIVLKKNCTSSVCLRILQYLPESVVRMELRKPLSVIFSV